MKRNLSNTSRICSITSGSLDLKQVLNYQLIYILSMYYWLAVCGFSPHLDSVRGFEPFLNSVCGFLPFQNSACSFWPFSTAICGFPCGNIRCDILGLTQLHQKHHSKKSPNKSPCPSPPIYIVAYNVCTVRFAEIIEIKNEIAPQFPISTHPFVLFCFVS